ncbi:hypothetical protein K1T73_08855 [Roseovarius sp. SCSIO 43702]|uniref:DUF6778 family protein n=1 Tax=Roseovarius sp. SCSIO 43702 TaxID=2823043 RepID=UPI001C737E20|nr:DUF6778 family protein [Roseovarius sp. SCSIO 43702]QYX58439.1 hypothetical protein K1T73_08855 [Roseovarius sp. SCSIO 43702]
MKPVRIFAALLLGLGLSACAATETATRNASLIADAPAPAAASIRVEEVTVSVPRSLKVSEANRYFPGGDIVWREDGPGDRHVQVQKIVEEAIGAGVTGLDGATPVDLHIEITRFHALTEKARYTTGGVHDIEFMVTLLHPETHQPLGPSHHVDAGFKAYGGQKAIAAEAKGLTQKVRINRHLQGVIRDELTKAGGHKQASLGVYKVFD